MPWPGITDFSEAIQNPRLCFKGTELETGAAETSPRGMPLVYAGAFACVYPVAVGGTSIAVRCFTHEVKDQQERYNQLSEYLINVLPPSFVHFEYVDRGISLKGSWYPIVKMDWVEGETLNKFVEERLQESDALRRLAAQWRGGTTASLRGLRIAHNDLQHGNVLVQPDGNIRLVDYDGVFLPQFHGQLSQELGHKNYQHPQRSSKDYDDHIDNFPSLVIYLSLLAIAAEPDLWTFNNDDNLILTGNDYADPAKSELFNRLKSSPDPAVTKLTERLEGYCALPIEQVPDLETALQGLPTSPIRSALVVRPAATSGVAAPAQPSPQSPAPPSGGYRQVLEAKAQSAALPVPPAAPPAQSTPSRDDWSRRADKWPRLLIGGFCVMFAGWLIQTETVSFLVNLVLLIGGIILILAVLWTKHPAFLVAGVIALIIRFTNLYDRLVDAVWTWVIIAGVVAVVIAGTTGTVRTKRAAGRIAIVLAVVIAVAGGFFTVTDYEIPARFAALFLVQRSTTESVNESIRPRTPVRSMGRSLRSS